MNWIADCLEVNASRGQLWNMHNEMMYVSPVIVSDGFMLNLNSVLLKLCDPFSSIDLKNGVNNKLLKIDPTYCAVEVSLFCTKTYLKCSVYFYLFCNAKIFAYDFQFLIDYKICILMKIFVLFSAIEWWRKETTQSSHTQYAHSNVFNSYSRRRIATKIRNVQFHHRMFLSHSQIFGSRL